MLFKKCTQNDDDELRSIFKVSLYKLYNTYINIQLFTTNWKFFTPSSPISDVWKKSPVHLSKRDFDPRVLGQKQHALGHVKLIYNDFI